MSGVNLDRTSKMGWAIQTDPAVAEDLDELAFATSIANDKETPTPNVYSRESKTGSLTKRPDIVGEREIAFAFDCEMIGGSTTVEPKWGELLRGGGFAVTGLKLLTLTGDTHPLSIGDIVGNNAVKASATKLGVVVYRDEANHYVVIRPTAGTWANADVVYNYSNANTDSGTVSGAPAAAGFGYTPQSETDNAPTTPLTMGRIADGAYTLGLGVRCETSIKYAFGKVPMVSVNAQGVLSLDDNGDALAPPTLGVIPSPGAVPLKCKGMPVRLYTKDDGSAMTPIFTQAEIKCGNTVTMRETCSDADVANSGYVDARITDRNPVLTIDPEHDRTGLLVMRHTMLGGTFKATLQHGLVSHGNGLVTIYAPQGQMSGSGNAETSNRNGISTKNLNIKLCGSADDEMGVYVVYIP